MNKISTKGCLIIIVVIIGVCILLGHLAEQLEKLDTLACITISGLIFGGFLLYYSRK